MSKDLPIVCRELDGTRHSSSVATWRMHGGLRKPPRGMADGRYDGIDPCLTGQGEAAGTGLEGVSRSGGAPRPRKTGGGASGTCTGVPKPKRSK